MQTTLRISLLSAVATACALSLSAHAADAPDFSKVVLYGDVTIAKDSTASWGVWEEIEPPSAGPSVSLTRIPSSNELYRPLAQVQAPAPTAPVEAAGLCASGALCGFGMLISYDYTQKDSEGQSKQPFVGLQGAVLTPQTATANSEIKVKAAAAPWLPAAIVLNVANLDGKAIAELTNVGPLTLSSSTYSTTNGEPTFGQDNAYLSTNVGQLANMFGVSEAIDPVIGNINRYAQGDVNTEQLSNISTSNMISGVWGITTSALDMAALKRGQVIATYTGATINPAIPAGAAPVTMNVDFGKSTFTASFNGGKDGQVSPSVAPNGQTYLFGAVGLNAVGTINGSNFTSTSVSALDGQVSGKVVGAFFGANAAVAGGVVDVVKTVSVPTSVNATAAANGSGGVTYTNAQYVSSFVAVRDDLVKVKVKVEAQPK